MKNEPKMNNRGGCWTVDMGASKSKVIVLLETAPTLTTTHYGSPAVAYREIRNERTDSNRFL